MRVVIQRVREASVTIDHKIHGSIDQGFLLLVGISENDDESVVEKVARKVANMRIFEDDEGKMNLDIHKIHGSILSISQFTLYADYKKGNRPGFSFAAKPDKATALYDAFNECLRKENITVETGVFGADMKVQLINDGPVTIIVDSEEL